MAKSGFRGGGIGGGMNMNMVRQAQKMQQDMMKLQEELESREYEASAGGGMVTAKVSGKRELTGITIDPDALDPQELDMLQDAIIAAVNEAGRKADAAQAEQMNRITGGLNLGF